MHDIAAATIRPLQVSEIDIARDMRHAMIGELDGRDADELYPGWRQRYIEFYRSRMEQDHAALYVAEADGRPIGVAAVYLLKNHRSEIFGRQSAYVSNVWVEPAHRRKGIAAGLTRHAIDWARAKGCEVIRLRSSQMGRPVYASLGFTPTEEMELRLDEPEHG
ncbi:MAG TPA: GNAT family N-acetyltransferase [Candidatus Eremiobacteraceae bacterium]|nr:GNAT family N-acetyltransferase [Candidatus Eremiobacteraceae bacterium]